MSKQIFRGELYIADLEPVIGCEQGGVRPVVILQNDVGNHYSETTIIAPLTSNIYNKAVLPVHCFISARSGLKLDSIILLEQIRAIE